MLRQKVRKSPVVVDISTPGIKGAAPLPIVVVIAVAAIVVVAIVAVIAATAIIVISPAIRVATPEHTAAGVAVPSATQHTVLSSAELTGRPDGRHLRAHAGIMRCLLILV